MRKTNFLKLMGVIIGSILLNLIASILWSLMGSPGKEKILELIRH
jgi:hypothetical protein